MYFTVNTAFVNYLDKFPNLTESPEFPIIKNETIFEHTLPISLNISKFDSTLLTALSDLKEFINSYTNDKKLSTNKIFVSDNYIMEIFLFITAIIFLLATILTVVLLCKHKEL